MNNLIAFSNRAFSVLGLALLLACGGSSGSGYGGNGGGGGGGNGVAPTFMTQPVGATVLAGGSATFTTAATATPDPTLQWDRSADGSTWTAISGATSATYSFTATKTDNGAQFRARASNTYGNATSTAAALTVNWAPSITTQPANQSVSSPNPAVFTFTMDANPAATCQWQSSSDGATWQDIPGATSTTYSTGTTSSGMNNLQFRCVCSNPVGSSTTAAATLIVNAPSFALSVNLGAGATGTPAAGGTYPAGTVVNYAYTPLSGFSGLQVLLDGSAAPASGSVIMDAAHALVVTAVPIQHTVTFTAGTGGSLTGNPAQSVANGDSTSAVTAVPSAGFTFVNWTGAGFTTSIANPLVVANVLQDLAITANFAPVAATYTITATAGIYGSISPSGAQMVAAGGSITFTISADVYYSIVDVMVDGASVGPVSSYSFTNVTANHTISARFY